MTVTPVCIIQSVVVTGSDVSVYTSPASTATIVDKFTATNTDSSNHTLNVNIIPSGGSVGAGNLVISVITVNANSTLDITQLQNQILNTGDAISVKASAASDIIVRGSGRQVTLP